MKLETINKKSIRKIDNRELITMHHRVHQLWGLKNRKYKYDLKLIHSIIANEMIRRKMKHLSDLKECLEQNINEYSHGDYIMKASVIIKILAMEKVLESKQSKEDKIKDLTYIKENADSYQCLGYILDEKIYNLNDMGKEELKKRFLKEQNVRAKQAASIAGLYTMGVAGLPYKLARALFDKCQKACGTLGINGPKRQICIAKCHVVSTTKRLDELKKIKADPKEIKKTERELIKYNNKLKKLQIWAVGTKYNRDPKVNPDKKSLFRAQ